MDTNRYFDLSGSWTLQRADGVEQLPVEIPGDNFSALLAAGAVADPYVGLNELDLQWIGRTDWLFRRTFILEEDFLKAPFVLLSCDSIDTCADIFVNDDLIGRSRNMFRRFRAEVRGSLRAGENEIRVRIHSAELEAERLSKSLPHPVPHYVYPVQSPHRNLIRKAQCHAGWDWGPCLMVSGIYGSVYLEACSQGWIEHVHTNPIPNGPDWEVEVIAEVHAPRGGSVPVEIAFAGARTASKADLEPGPNTLRIPLIVKSPQLWWPAGYGNQSLHELSVRAAGDELRKRIGFRKLEVINADDEAGRSMTFSVNGRKLFAKGANWIPCDALPARQTPERYEALLESAVRANMNMLRVWGGGQYERELLYDLCDQKGLLVWQDFMFSCATYPATEEFLADVEQEARYQVKRLKDHPCLALWCGNNENLGALNWFPESRADRALYLAEYERLNEGVLGRVARELDPGRTWWPSSPSAGVGDYSDNWHDDSKGDMHYWSVWHEGKSFEAYYDITPRFCSEFGFQSFPSLDTVRSFASEDQWNVTSPVMEHHQRHPRGNTVILETMTRYFRFPEGFESFLYLSQIQQALAIKMAVEYWRSRRPVFMGSLYWQLNDLWPVASWSSIEYSGAWKLLHYEARRFYAPLHLAAFLSKGKDIEVFGLNDTLERHPGELLVQFMDFHGLIRREERIPAVLEAEAATRFTSKPFTALPAKPEEVFLAFFFRSNRLALENFLFLAPPKRCPLEQPELRYSLRAEGGGAVVELSAERPAFFVALEFQGIRGTFDDNNFFLLPGTTKIVRFSPAGEPLSEGQYRELLRIRHLRGTYP